MEHPWLLPWGESRCLPQPRSGAAQSPIAPGLPVSLVTKGLSHRLDSALGSSCSCHEPSLALHRGGLSVPPWGRALPTGHVCWEAGLGESSLQLAMGTLRHKERS